MKAPNITRGPWLPMQPLGKSYSDHGYRAVAHIQRVSPITIYAERDNLVVEGKGCVFGDVEADAKMLAAAPMLAEALNKFSIWNRTYPSSRIYNESAIRKIAKELDAIYAEADAALKAAGYTEE